MGSEQSSYCQRFYSRYSFVQTLMDRNYGLIKIYRKRQHNFDYVMVVERLVSTSELQQTKLQLEQIRHSFTEQRQPMLLRLLHVTQAEKRRCGGTALQIYMEYLNFSLRDALQMRKQADLPLTLDEVMYVLQSACQTYLFFKRLNYNYLSLRADSIFITPQGLLRFSPIRIEDNLSSPENCDCSMDPIPVYFQKTQRLFLIELKNLLMQLVSACPRNDDNFKNSYQLLADINHSRTLQNMMFYLWEPQVEGINFGKKIPESTDISQKEGQPLYASSAKPKRVISVTTNQV